MDNLVKGKTVIGNRYMKDRATDAVIEVEVLYGNEEFGFLRTVDGDIKKCPDEEYKKELAAYRAKLYRETEADRIMNESPEYAQEYDEDDAPETAEPETGTRNELVRQNNGKIVTADMIRDARKLDRKKLKVPFIILGSVAALMLILLLVSTFTSGNKKKSPAQDELQTESSIGVAVLGKDVAVGELISTSDFEASYVSRETFDLLSKTTYIGANGKSHEGTVILWNDIDSYDNYVALRTIPAGTVAMADDFALSRSAITGQMTIRLVAVIGSDSLDDGEIVCELGRYVVEAGSLRDILNSQGQSVLGELYDEAATEETAENIEVPVEAPDEEPISEVEPEGVQPESPVEEPAPEQAA